MIISLDSDVTSSLVRRQSIDQLHVAKGALHSCSGHRQYHSYGEQSLDVREGHTLENCVTSSCNDNLLISSSTSSLNAFHSNLVSGVSTSAGVENISLSYSIVVLSP